MASTPSFSLPPRPGRPGWLGLLCGSFTFFALALLVTLRAISPLFLLLSIPVGVLCGVVWGRIASRRFLIHRLEEILRRAVERLEKTEEAESAYAVLLDALDSYSGVAGAALFLQHARTKSGSSPVLTCGALLGLRKLPQINDVSHLFALIKEETVLHRVVLQNAVTKPSEDNSERILFSVLTDSNLDLIWVLRYEEETIAVVMIREAIGTTFNLRFITEQLRAYSSIFAKKFRDLSTRVVEQTPSTKQPAVKPSFRKPSVVKASQTLAPDVLTPPTIPRLPIARAFEPWMLLPSLARLIEVAPKLGKIWEEVQERAGRHTLIKLSGARGSVAKILTQSLAETRGGNFLRFPTPEKDPWKKVASWIGFGTILFDEERAGFFPESVEGVLLIVVTRQKEDAIEIPTIKELGIVSLAEVLLEHLAPGEKRILSEDAKLALEAYKFQGDLEELALVLTRGVLLTSSEKEIAASELGLSAIPSHKPEKEKIPDKTEKTTEEVESFHEAVLEFKRVLVTRALAKTGGNRAKAARLLRLQRTYLYRLIRQLRIDTKEGTEKEFDETTASR